MPVKCKLRGVLAEYEMSQRQLSLDLNLSPSEIYKYLNNLREPRVGTAILIARHLGVSVEDLWQYDVPKRRAR